MSSSSDSDLPASARASARRRGGGRGGGCGADGGHRRASLLPLAVMKVTALAGGIGAGKFLRGLTRVVPGEDLTVVVNVADDVVVHGLHVSPGPRLGDLLARRRLRSRSAAGAGATRPSARPRRSRAFDRDRAWFGLGDLDLGTHLFRTGLLAEGATAVGGHAADRRPVRRGARLLPVSDDPIETRIDCTDAATGEIARPPLPGVLGAPRRRRPGCRTCATSGPPRRGPRRACSRRSPTADAVVFCPSNPVVSIGPILAVPGDSRRRWPRGGSPPSA